MSRMENSALAAVIDNAEGGGYTLPPELLRAWGVFTRLRTTVVPDPAPRAIEDAADQIIAAATAGQDPDLLALGRDLELGDHDQRAANRAGQVLSLAIEGAGNIATGLANQLTETIITDHLRPALDQVHEQARECATILHGHGSLDPKLLISASSKVRTAYGQLPALVARNDAIRAARTRINIVGHRKPEHDDADIFATFRRPLHFHPHWTVSSPVPHIPWPTDPFERLLWQVSDEARPAGLWLPTVAEQDAAWWDVFGESLTNRRQARTFATELSHRAS